MTHDDAELAQLRLIDHFLEGEGDDPVAGDGFDNEVDRAILAGGNSKLRDIRLALDRRNSDAWVYHSTTPGCVPADRSRISASVRQLGSPGFEPRQKDGSGVGAGSTHSQIFSSSS